MSWLAQNGADLVGHAVTIGVVAAGFFKLRREMRLEVGKEHNVRHYDRRVQAIQDCAGLMENVRTQLYMLAIHPFDRDEPLDAVTEQKLATISALRAQWFAATVFIPGQLKADVEAINAAFDQWTRALLSNSPSDWERANEGASGAVGRWRIRAQEWADSEWERLRL